MCAFMTKFDKKTDSKSMNVKQGMQLETVPKGLLLKQIGIKDFFFDSRSYAVN